MKATHFASAQDETPHCVGELPNPRFGGVVPALLRLGSEKATQSQARVCVCRTKTSEQTRVQASSRPRKTQTRARRRGTAGIHRGPAVFAEPWHVRVGLGPLVRFIDFGNACGGAKGCSGPRDWEWDRGAKVA